MKLALGTAQFGLDYGISNQSGKTHFNEVKKILDVAEQNNIHTIDTSCSYGDAETTIGKYTKNKIYFDIITKTPSINEESINNIHSKKIISTFEKSLQQLQQPSIHGLLIHSSNDLLKPNGEIIYKAIDFLKSQRLIKKIGISIYNKQQLKEVISNFDVDIVQLPFNILDQSLFLDGTLEQLKKNKIEIHARSAFLQGLLLMPLNKLPPYFLPYQNFLKKFEDYAVEQKASKLKLALGYINSISEIDKIICGVNNCQHLNDIIKAIDYKVIPHDVKHLAIKDPSLLCPTNWP